MSLVEKLHEYKQKNKKYKIYDDNIIGTKKFGLFFHSFDGLPAKCIFDNEIKKIVKEEWYKNGKLVKAPGEEYTGKVYGYPKPIIINFWEFKKYESKQKQSLSPPKWILGKWKGIFDIDWSFTKDEIKLNIFDEIEFDLNTQKIIDIEISENEYHLITAESKVHKFKKINDNSIQYIDSNENIFVSYNNGKEGEIIKDFFKDLKVEAGNMPVIPKGEIIYTFEDGGFSDIIMSEYINKYFIKEIK